MTDTAELEIVCPGMLAGVLEVLCIGKGDLKLELGNEPEDMERARTIIETMLRSGYSIFLETEDGPVRVTKFNPGRMTYVITDIVKDDETASAEEETSDGPTSTTPEPPPRRSKSRRVKEREVPIAGSRATAVGRTAGG